LQRFRTVSTQIFPGARPDIIHGWVFFARSLSSSAPFDDRDQQSLLDVLSDNEDDRGEIAAMFNDALCLLEPREANIVRLYFGIGRDYACILREIGERVRQLKEDALCRLREILSAYYVKQ
jgi:RNA polymerase primary sigma factor